MTDTSPEPAEENTFVAEQTAEVHATVQHHAPCVPECPVCYPKDAD